MCIGDGLNSVISNNIYEEKKSEAYVPNTVKLLLIKTLMFTDEK